MDFSFITDETLRGKVTEAVTAAIEEATNGLQTKNAELLGKLKKAKQGADIDPLEYQQLMANSEKMEAENSELKKAVKRLQTDLEKGQKALLAESSIVSRLLVDNGLNDAMLKANVRPEMQKAVKAMLAGQVVLKQEGDSKAAFINDKSLSDFVGEWAKSDEGKHFVAAPQNQGGGANGGSNGNGSAKLMDRTAFESLPPAKQMAFIKDGGKVQSVQ